MKLEEIDKNFKFATLQETDVEWIAVHENTQYLRGVFFSQEEDCFRRMPKSVSSTVNSGVDWLSEDLAGGRICIKTDSPYVAVKCLVPFQDQMSHITIFAQYGCAVREDGDYRKLIAPSFQQLCNPIDGLVAYEGIHYTVNPNAVHTYEIYLPLYGGAKRIYIGLKRGAKVEVAPVRKYKKPVVFYGSSITQGGCATRPDNDYVSMLCRWLDTEYINLGFSGSAHGEQTMAEYIGSLDSSVIVLDYDHNSGLEELRQRHYSFYQTIRKLRPATPIILISKPDYDYDPQGDDRAAVLMDTLEKARANGDQNITFIHGKTLFGDEDRSVCTVDCCHPNDIGFFRMAKTIYPVLKNLL